MGKFYERLDAPLTEFIQQQHMFFVGSASGNSSVNISPKGLDAFRILDDATVAYLDVTGSGNETSAHIEQGGNMTVMFCAFEGRPKIVRLYGKGEVVRPRDARWGELFAHFTEIPGTRQIIVVHIARVQTSCGMAVPLYDYVGQRDELVTWAEKKGADGLETYWRDRNQQSIDGLPTRLLE